MANDSDSGHLLPEDAWAAVVARAEELERQWATEKEAGQEAGQDAPAD